MLLCLQEVVVPHAMNMLHDHNIFYIILTAGLKLPAMVVLTTIQIGYINLHAVEVTLLGN